MVKVTKEKLIERIYRWVVRDTKVSIKKERLLKVMIEATLDYLYTKDYLVMEDKEVNGKN